MHIIPLLSRTSLWCLTWTYWASNTMYLCKTGQEEIYKLVQKFNPPLLKRWMNANKACWFIKLSHLNYRQKLWHFLCITINKRPFKFYFIKIWKKYNPSLIYNKIQYSSSFKTIQKNKSRPKRHLIDLRPFC